MDSRWKFLHPVPAELRGRGREARAGKGKPGASTGCGMREARVQESRRCEAERNRSSEECRPAAEKSRYSLVRARTVNRHRWMGRESQGRREKCCQGTRQNGPVTSGEGAPGEAQAAENRPKQLFSKNTGLCKTAR